jgi:hypothetical protein
MENKQSPLPLQNYKHEDLLNVEWYIAPCETKGCWCAIVMAKLKDEFNEDYHVIPAAAIPKVVAARLVKLHNAELKQSHEHTL